MTVPKDVPTSSLSASVVKDAPSSFCTEVEDQLSETVELNISKSATSAVEDQQAAATSSATSSYVSNKSKNKRRQCSLCPFFGTHLQRHIAAKHPQNFTSKPEQLTLVHKHDKLSQQQKKQDVRRFQCTYKKCGSIVTRLGQHLSRVHKLKDPKELKQVKANCLRLSTGSSGKRKKGSQAASRPKAKVPKVEVTKPCKKQHHDTDEESDDESTFESGGSTTDEHNEVDHHQLKVDADVDDISSFAESDEEENTIPLSDQQKWRDSYLAKNPNRNVREYFMSRFYKYLLHVEGGAHSQQQALIHARQVHIILTTLDPSGTDLACLAKRSGLDLWDKFCIPKLKNKELSGNTLKVYLRSMEFFVKFIANGLLYKKEMLNERHKEVILHLRDRLPEYRGTIHRRTGHQTTTRKVNEAFARLTPADLRQVEASEPAKNAIKLIGLVTEDKPLTASEFITVRDYLLVTTLYENGSRPGPLENALVSRFHQATYSASNDRYTILVDKHKTTRHHGPAELTVTSRLFSYLQIYAIRIRPKYAAAGEDALFVKDDGHAFNPGTIGKRVTQFFHQAGIRTDVRVTATNIRKMITDKAYELSPTKKRLIHGHMKHSERTADSNYVIRLNAERASQAHQLVQNIIRENPPSTAPKAQEHFQEQKEDKMEGTTSQTVSGQKSRQKVGKNDATPLETVTEPAQEDEDDDCNDSNNDLPLAVTMNKREKAVKEGTDESDVESGIVSFDTASVRSLKDDDKSVLLTVYNDEISNGKLLTIDEVRSKMRGDLYLRKMVVHAEFVKKVADFVRYKCNLTRQLQLSQLGEQNDDYMIQSVSAESGLRRPWSVHDAAVIKAKFESLTNIPRKKEIMALFSSDQVLSHILEREGATRCYEKVKNLLKSAKQ